MQIERLVMGELQANCYIVTKNDKTIIIDPGDEANKIIDAVKDKNVVGILVTHHHFDHIGALKEIEDYFHLKESLNVTGFNYEICYYFKDDKVLFSGDFIFYKTIGRTDFPTGSDEKMHQSLELISKYPDNIKVYPGHGPSTILGDEKVYFRLYLKKI